MNLKEAWQLLTLASARDGRTVDKEVAIVWADDLAHITIQEAAEAARMHYQQSTAWMMPAHVIANVKRIRERVAREESVRRQLTPEPAVWSEEGIAEYHRVVQELKEQKHP